MKDATVAHCIINARTPFYYRPTLLLVCPFYRIGKTLNGGCFIINIIIYQIVILSLPTRIYLYITLLLFIINISLIDNVYNGHARHHLYQLLKLSIQVKKGEIKFDKKSIMYFSLHDY